MKQIVISALIIVIASCEDFHPREEQIFYIQNNSNQSVSYMLSENYPDTVLPGNIIVTLLPGMEHVEGFKESKLEDFFETLPRDTLSIFFIDSDTLKDFDLQQIRDNYLILERRDYSLLDITMVNKSRIVFP
jgi:hypothetical protein